MSITPSHAQVAYNEWRQAMEAAEMCYFRVTRLDVVVKLLSSTWNGFYGEVYCERVVDGVHRTVPHYRLEPLNAMEVIAYAAK